MSGPLRILIVDDDRNMTHTLADILALKGHEPAEAACAAEAIEKAQGATFDLVLSDVKMPGMNGVELHRELDRIQPGLPVVLMTAYSSEDLIRQGLDEGVIDALDKPLKIGRFLDFLVHLAESRGIAIVDDDPAFCRTLAEILASRGFHVVTITDPHAAVDEIVAGAQLVLLDMKLNHVGGEEVLRRIRARFLGLPVLLVTGHGGEMAAAVQRALDLGAAACLLKPLDIPELLRTLAQVRLGGLRRSMRKG